MLDIYNDIDEFMLGKFIGRIDRSMKERHREYLELQERANEEYSIDRIMEAIGKDEMLEAVRNRMEGYSISLISKSTRYYAREKAAMQVIGRYILRNLDSFPAIKEYMIKNHIMNYKAKETEHFYERLGGIYYNVLSRITDRLAEYDRITIRIGRR